MPLHRIPTMKLIKFNLICITKIKQAIAMLIQATFSRTINLLYIKTITQNINRINLTNIIITKELKNTVKTI